MNYRDIFLTIVYVILLIIMFSFIALIISSGEGDKKLSWAFYGFAMITSVICILSILRSGRKRLVYWGMSVATILMTIFLITSIILSKPTESTKVQVVAYVMLLLIVAINGLSLYLLTQKSKMIELPVEAARNLNLINKDNDLVEPYASMSETSSFTSSFTSNVQQPIPQPIPQPNPQPIPQPIPQPNPQPIPQPIPQPMSPEMSSEMSPEMSPQMPPQYPQQMPPQYPQQMPPQMPPQMPQQMPQQMPPQMPPQMPQQMPPQGQYPQLYPQPFQQYPQQMPQYQQQGLFGGVTPNKSFIEPGPSSF